MPKTARNARMQVSMHCAEQAGIPGKAGTDFLPADYADEILNTHKGLTGEILEVVEPGSHRPFPQYWVKLDCDCVLLIPESALTE